MSKKKNILKPKTAVSPKKPYQKPAIIYEGFVSTRAGSPIAQPEETFDIVDYMLGKR